MSDDATQRQQLLDRIKAKRASITAFVRELDMSGDRQTNLSIICSAVATALTAGPALGGTSFSGGAAKALALPDDSLVWRILCLGAMVLSLVATISLNLYKSHDVAGRLSKAEAASAGLEGLETLIEFGQISVVEAAKLYQQYVAEVSFIPDK